MAADRGAGTRPVTCPDCGAPVRPERERLCPRCGYPLMFLRPASEPGGFAVARSPGERDDATAVLASGAPPPPDARLTGLDDTLAGVDDVLPGIDEVTCPQCGDRNPGARVRCQRCGHELRTARPVPVPLPPPEPPARAPRRRWWPVVAGILVAGLLVGAGYLLARQLLAGGAAPAPDPSVSAAPVLVDRRSVRVTASSTIPAAEDPHFAVARIADGDPATAWQSDGKRLTSNVGVRLTFRFDRPVRLARISVVNGYARTPQDFRNNERVARWQVRRDTGSTGWTLEDTAQPQSLDLDAAATTTVTFVVERVHPSTRWPDLAVSEVTFYERR